MWFRFVAAAPDPQAARSSTVRASDASGVASSDTIITRHARTAMAARDLLPRTRTASVRYQDAPAASLYACVHGTLD